MGQLPVLLLVMVGVAGCEARPSALTSITAEQAISVKTAPIRRITIDRTVPVTGTLFPYDDMPLSPKVEGRVMHILRDVGDRVFPGEVLMELDPTDYVLSVAQARAAYEAELVRLKVSHLPRSIEEFEAILPQIDAVAQARANWELAEKELARAELEFNRGVGSPQGLDAARTRVKVARAALAATETEMRAAWVNARRLLAVLQDAEEKLREVQLRVPFPQGWEAWAAIGGVAACPIRLRVSERRVAIGEMIRMITAPVAYRVVSDHVLKLRASVPEKYRPAVALDNRATISVEAWPSQTFAGRVTRIYPTVDPATRTFRVEIEVPNFDGKLTAGGFAQAQIVTSAQDHLLTVPYAAVVSFVGVHKVFVVRDGVARAVVVELGVRDKDWVEIRGPLQEGEQVAVTGQTQLLDGSAVKPRE